MSVRGRDDEALALGKRGIQLDPSTIGLRMNAAAFAHYARRYEALEQWLAIVALSPDFINVRPYLLLTYQARGLYEEAVGTFQTFMRLGGADEEEISELSEAYQASGEEGYWRWMLKYWKEKATEKYVRPTLFAHIHASLGEKEEALEDFRDYIEQSRFSAPIWAAEPVWNPVREDPEFRALLRRMNLE